MSSSILQSAEPNLLTYLKNTYLFENISEEILDVLFAELERIFLSEGETLIQQGGTSNALYIVLKGRLKAILIQEDGSQIFLGEINSGEIVGEIQILLGGKHTANVCAISDTELIKLPKASFDRLINKYPDILQKIAIIIVQRLRHDQLVSLLPNLFGPCPEMTRKEIESQIEWCHLQRGEALFRQGDAGDSLYIVVSGLLQAVLEDEDGNEQVIGEVYRGESVGEMAIITGADRAASIYALRDSDLVKFSKSAFERLIKQCPQIMTVLTQIIIRRLQKSIQPPSGNNQKAVNIAVFPVSPEISLNHFCHLFVSALSVSDSTLHLSSKSVDSWIGQIGASQIHPGEPQSMRLLAWLEERANKYRFIIYQTDMTDTSWTRWCLRQAEQVILVADANANAVLSEMEIGLLSYYSRIIEVNQILVLLHSNEHHLPSGTQQWLSVRKVTSHHHIRWNQTADFERLARFISGRSIGLVLGGGGARGFAHIGVFQALKEANIQIDMIGGTSMGAFIGAQCAAEWSFETMRRINRKGLIESNPFKEFTLPIISLVGSRKLRSSLKKEFGDTYIEDLWLNFFCISSNLCTHEMVIHRQGLLEKALRCSAAIPGIAEPVLENGNLLVDGGILNNLPGDIMRQFCSTVIVVDVSSDTKDLMLESDTMPSSWEVFWSRILPFKKTIQVPSLLEILMNSTLLSSLQRAKQVKADADLYLHPPVEKFSLLEFTALEELIEVGYQHAKEEIEKWKIN